MAEAYVYDAVRTPRGRGKKDGSLHEVPAVRLAAKTLEAIRDRNELDTGLVDDIIFGCVDPVGEAGAVIPRAATTRPPASSSRASAPPVSTPSIWVRPKSRRAPTTSSSPAAWNR
jgi:acetyl-CoA acetyltransferase